MSETYMNENVPVFNSEIIFYMKALILNTNVCFIPLSLCFRLALYVYEYLLHVGAQKSAQTFLSEVRSSFSLTSCT